MRVEHERIPFAGDECFSVLRWRESTARLVALEANGATSDVAGSGGRWHNHEEVQLTLFTGGSGTRYIGESVGRFRAGESYLIGSYLPHCWAEDGPTGGYIVQMSVGAGHPLRRLGGGREIDLLLSRARFGLAFGTGAAGSLVPMLDAMAVAPSLERLGLFLELLSRLHERLDGAAALCRSAATTPTRGSATVEPIVQWIVEHYSHDLALGQAVERSGMARATFCRAFARHTGLSFGSYLTEVRLAHAHESIRRSGGSIAEIAFACGFGSISRFNEAFRARFGMSPRELRRSAPDRPPR